MYIEAVLKGYSLINVPVNDHLRMYLSQKSEPELTTMLIDLKKVHNTTDLTERERLIRAIEIETYYRENGISTSNINGYSSIIVGINYPREIIRKRITERLQQRLDGGMIEEVKSLLDSGISSEKLKYYGLEYKFITQYLCDGLAYDEMVRLLNIAIHQFAKRQMTWFRRMEKQGFIIHWVDGAWSEEEKLEFVLSKRKS